MSAKDVFVQQNYPVLKLLISELSELEDYQVITRFRTNETLQGNLEQLYYNVGGLSEDEQAFKEAFRQQVTRALGDLCVQSLSFAEFVFTNPRRYLRDLIWDHEYQAETFCKIFHHYEKIEESQRASSWLTELWRTKHRGHEILLYEGDWGKFSKKRSENILWLCEEESVAHLVLDRVLNYKPMPGGLKLNWSKNSLVTLEPLIEVAKRWPKLAYRILNAISMHQENSEVLQQLLTIVKSYADKNHVPSMQSYLIYCFLTQVDSRKETLNQCETSLHNEINSVAYAKLLQAFANILSGQTMPERILDFCALGAAPFTEAAIDLELAYSIYERALEVCNDPVVSAELRQQLNDPNFCFQLAEHYQLQGRYQEAQKFYSEVYQNAQIQSDTQQLLLRSIPLQGNKKNALLKSASEVEQEQLEFGHQANLRILMMLVERCNGLNKKPEADPELCKRMADKLIELGKFAQSLRLLQQIPEGSKEYGVAQAKLKFGAQHVCDINPTEPFICRQDIVEFVLPYAEKVAQTGFPDAVRMLDELNNEVEKLRMNKPAGYDARFVANIASTHDQVLAEEKYIKPFIQ